MATQKLGTVNSVVQCRKFWPFSRSNHFVQKISLNTSTSLSFQQSKYAAVTWYNHFPNQLIRPYGKIEAALTTKQIKEKLNPKNCEWFTRPKVAMSEMAATSSENIKGARQVLRRWLQDDIISMMVKYKDAVHPLNTKNDAPVTPEVVSKMMQFHCTKEPNEVKFFEDTERLGNISFLIGTHFRSLRTLILNMKDYAQMIQQHFLLVINSP